MRNTLRENDKIYFSTKDMSKSDINETGKECLSNYYLIPFMYNQDNYSTAQQFFLVQKAKLFNDHHTAFRILLTDCPNEAVKIADKIKDYDEEVWKKNMPSIFKLGLLCKFLQNEGCKKYLTSTYPAQLVQDDSTNLIWGMRRMSLTDNDNFIANCLMAVRGQLIDIENFLL